MNTGYSRQRTADSMIQLRQFSICSDLESYFRRQSKAILNWACDKANTEDHVIFRSDPKDSFWSLQNPDF